jgi:hypothetical protein
MNAPTPSSRASIAASRGLLAARPGTATQSLGSAETTAS